MGYIVDVRGVSDPLDADSIVFELVREGRTGVPRTRMTLRSVVLRSKMAASGKVADDYLEGRVRRALKRLGVPPRKRVAT